MQKVQGQQEKEFVKLLFAGLAIGSLFVGSVTVAADKVVVIPLIRSSSTLGIITHIGIRYGTVNHNDEIWLDRNLGAARVGLSKSDSHAYGDLYQWGRGTDGHESRTSPTTSSLSASDTPGYGDFITINSTPYDWKNSRNDNLWQGVLGTNNPCPPGYRLPTETEWQTEITSFNSSSSTGAFASPLKLVVAGYRYHANGTISYAGSYGNYWSATVNNTDVRYLAFNNNIVNIYSNHRANGFSVRCIKD